MRKRAFAGGQRGESQVSGAVFDGNSRATAFGFRRQAIRDRTPRWLDLGCG
jgi:hypothetical protein